jgi:hypothetical protein
MSKPAEDVRDALFQLLQFGLRLLHLITSAILIIAEAPA